MTQRRGQRILEDELTKEILTRWDSLDEKEKDDQEREKVHREMEKGKIKRKKRKDTSDSLFYADKRQQAGCVQQ